jgi:plasmid stability protein
MATTLSIKNVPDDVMAGLHNRAVRNQRSLNSEVLSILAQAAQGQTPVSLDDVIEQAQRKKPTLDQAASQVEARQSAEHRRVAERFHDLWSSAGDDLSENDLDDDALRQPAL